VKGCEEGCLADRVDGLGPRFGEGCFPVPSSRGLLPLSLQPGSFLFAEPLRLRFRPTPFGLEPRSLVGVEPGLGLLGDLPDPRLQCAPLVVCPGVAVPAAVLPIAGSFDRQLQPAGWYTLGAA
jgi:hypothetical protein